MEAGWVQVGSYDLATQATMAQMRLESEGIAATLADLQTVQTDWLLSNAIGGIKLSVPAAEEARARKILAEMRDGDASPDVRLQDAFYCAACGEQLSRIDEPCPACGAVQPEVDPDEDDDGVEAGLAGGQTGMDSLRSMKRPLAALLLLPVFGGALLIAFVSILILIPLALVISLYESGALVGVLAFIASACLFVLLLRWLFPR